MDDRIVAIVGSGMMNKNEIADFLFAPCYVTGKYITVDQMKDLDKAVKRLCDEGRLRRVGHGRWSQYVATKLRR